MKIDKFIPIHRERIRGDSTQANKIATLLRSLCMYSIFSMQIKSRSTGRSDSTKVVCSSMEVVRTRVV